jgi:hypothetical protein
MKFGILAATASALAVAVAAPASAAVVLSFGPGGSSPLAGLTVFEDFEGSAASITSGSGYLIQGPPSNGNGAVIPNSTFPGAKYLTVLGGGNATITFAPGVNRFSFDWGSLDTYNTLRINYNSGSFVNVIPGTTFVNVANGNQVLNATNGVFSVVGTAGETFDSIKLTSGRNSFEIDNVAVGVVPEPATWAMMIIGFGAAGSLIRRRRAMALTA